jgi:hypothetical protein
MRRLLTLAGATSASLAFLLCGQAAAQTLELSPAGKRASRTARTR